MKRMITLFAVLTAFAFHAVDSKACTGISLTSADGSRIVARTVEWAATPMQCGYVVAPRGHAHQSYTPTGDNGLKYNAVYGYVGIYTEYEPFVVEGINEAGLSAGLFFFPQYGEYAPYNEAHNAKTLCDMQFVSWVLSQFSSIDQVKEAIKNIDLVTLNHKIGAVHWRIAQPDGRMVVLEVVAGVPHFYENKLGVLTNAPGFPWHMTNLNNYVNLVPGSAPDNEIKPGITLQPLGHGSGMLGLPGDFTAPSRFVRATFFQTTSPVWATGFETVVQAFHILNNFDIPIGSQHLKADIPKNLPSATQFTAVTDQTAMKFYYRTAWNSNIRCIDLMGIDFHKVKYQSHPLDEVQQQPVEMVKLK
ncbi:MAG: linear amide C-N hydrolase [Bacteroidales bacterium]|nr:linear amide C-N hydrolase [Bacteroidales bacterium]MBQ8500482.1 linear amide C-N hydrolase [Bacteroidales bacterium]